VEIVEKGLKPLQLADFKLFYIRLNYDVLFFKVLQTLDLGFDVVHDGADILILEEVDRKASLVTNLEDLVEDGVVADVLDPQDLCVEVFLALLKDDFLGALLSWFCLSLSTISLLFCSNSTSES